jgi:hypothetical protein
MFKGMKISKHEILYVSINPTINPYNKIVMSR